MEDLNNKATNDELSASEWNGTRSEVQNIIENAGLTLSAGDQNQLGKAISDLVANADSFIGAGTANAHVISVLSSNQAPTAYKDLMRVRYRPSITNTGAVTVAVAGLAAKAVTINNAALTGAEMPSGQSVTLEYHNSNGKFNIIVREYPEVTGFSHGSGAYFATNGVIPTNFDIDAVIGSSFESVGPTGSSATNIWTAMDNIPLGAVSITIRLTHLITGSTNGDTYSVISHCRGTGSGVGPSVDNIVIASQFINRSGSPEEALEMSEISITLDSTNKFDINLTSSGTSPTILARMVVVGFSM